jgi:hypothetical protein
MADGELDTGALNDANIVIVPIDGRCYKIPFIPSKPLVRSHPFPDHFDPDRSPWLLCP